MTALERRWVESEWDVAWADDLSSVWIERCIDEEAGVFLCVQRSTTFLVDGWGYCPTFSLGWNADEELKGPLSSSIEQAKSDAEAMYRQWVYDEYGVVLA